MGEGPDCHLDAEPTEGAGGPEAPLMASVSRSDGFPHGIARVLADLERILGDPGLIRAQTSPTQPDVGLVSDIKQRVDSIGLSIVETASESLSEVGEESIFSVSG